MITLRRLDLVRQDSQATAEELQSLQLQINTQLDALDTKIAESREHRTQQTVGPTGTAAALPTKPAGYMEFQLGTAFYVVPFYLKA